MGAKRPKNFLLLAFPGCDDLFWGAERPAKILLSCFSGERRPFFRGLLSPSNLLSCFPGPLASKPKSRLHLCQTRRQTYHLGQPRARRRVLELLLLLLDRGAYSKGTRQILHTPLLPQSKPPPSPTEQPRDRLSIPCVPSGPRAARKLRDRGSAAAAAWWATEGACFGDKERVCKIWPIPLEAPRSNNKNNNNISKARRVPGGVVTAVPLTRMCWQPHKVTGGSGT